MMRFGIVSLGLAAVLVAGSAFAEGGSGGKGDRGDKGSRGDKGGTGPGSDVQEPEAGAQTDTTQIVTRKTRATENPDQVVTQQEERPWFVGATWETHRLIRQEDVANEKVVNSLFFSAGYNITDRDLVSASWGISQSFIADPGETGFRGSDINLAYTRLIPLPERFNWRITASGSIPVSYYSQLASNITTLGLSTGLSRRFGDLLLSANISGSVAIDKYAESAGTDGFGGQENPKWHLGGSLIAEYSMPFHRPLSMGLGLTDSYGWAYNVQNGGGCLTQVICQQGVVSDGVYTSQPMRQSYGGEIFARYILPTVMGFQSNATLALASGDGGIGFNQLLHDGVVHPYLFYRNTAEIYAALDFRY